MSAKLEITQFTILQLMTKHQDKMRAATNYDTAASESLQVAAKVTRGLKCILLDKHSPSRSVVVKLLKLFSRHIFS